MGAESDLLGDGRHDGRMTVPQEQGAMAAEIVDVLIPVGIPLPGSGGAGRINWIGQQCAGVVRQSRRDDMASALIELRGALCSGTVLSFDFRVRPQLSHVITCI